MKRQRILPDNCEPFAVSREEGAALWGVGCTKFDELVADGTIPRPLRIGARALWDLRGLRRAWMKFADENGAPDINTPWEEVKRNGYQKLTEIRTKSVGGSAR
jgi:predicted DNA-binding transcriptional regulator AlpA